MADIDLNWINVFTDYLKNKFSEAFLYSFSNNNDICTKHKLSVKCTSN